MVATGATEESEEDAEVSLDLARTFAKEKNLQLVTCDVEDGDRVDTAFATLIDIIMSNILPSTLGGQYLCTGNCIMNLLNTESRVLNNY